MNEEETEKQINDKTDLPKAIIVKNVPKELFDEPQLKENFANLFKQIDENVRIDYLKGFQRVRVVFTEPEHATAAKLLVEHHSFNGVKLKAFFAQNINFTRKAFQDEEGHLKLPPLEKQFLISPPTSPPVGWEQSIEMAPVVCNFDLMARLAAFSIDDNYEVHSGEDGQPAIVVTPCKVDGEDGGPESGLGTPKHEKIALPHTPRPPKKEISSSS